MAVKWLSTFILLLSLPVFGAATDLDSASDGFVQSQIQQTYDGLTPAMCIIRYSMEITNPNSGEVSRRSGHALGLMVSADGLVLAHGHLQLENRRPENIKVTVGDDDETEYDAIILKKPDDINVVFLQLESDEAMDFPFVSFQPESELGLGENVLLLGLLRQSFDYAPGLQTRRIGAVLEEPRKTYALDRSTPIGYVGGPVVNVRGDVVGVLGFDLSAGEGGEIYTRSGHPLVFQTALFQKYIDDPPSEEEIAGEREDAWLGVFTQPLTDDLAEYWGLPQDGGVVVSTVLDGSPAYQSGLRMGDVILNFDGTPVVAKLDQDVIAFTKLVRESPLDHPLDIHLMRDGEPVDMRLTLRPRPKTRQEAREFEETAFGLTIRELTTDVRIALNLPEEVGGVIVRRVKSGSPASLAGIRPGYVILAVSGRPIRDIEGYQRAVEAEAAAQSSEVTLFCRVGANTAFFRIQPRWAP